MENKLSNFHLFTAEVSLNNYFIPFVSINLWFGLRAKKIKRNMKKK